MKNRFTASSSRKPKKLLKLCVAIGAVSLLAALAMPAVNDWLEKGRGANLENSAALVYKVWGQAALDSIVSGDVAAFPVEPHATTAAIFAGLVADGYVSEPDLRSLHFEKLQFAAAAASDSPPPDAIILVSRQGALKSGQLVVTKDGKLTLNQSGVSVDLLP